MGNSEVGMRLDVAQFRREYETAYWSLCFDSTRNHYFDDEGLVVRSLVQVWVFMWVPS